MSDDTTSRRNQTIETIAEILEVDPGGIEAGARLREDLGMDSLGSLELLSVLSEQLRIDLEIDEAMGIVTVDDACAFVERSFVSQESGRTADA